MLNPHLARALADGLVLAHFAFVIFVAAGAFLVLRWRWLAWVHIPAAVWGITIELTGWICPLTPLENALRTSAGGSPYAGDFIARYLLPVIYPEGLTRAAQVLLGALALAINGGIYAWILWSRHARAQAEVKR